MIQRFKKLWKLSRLSDNSVDAIVKHEEKLIEKGIVVAPIEGDGKAEFLSDMTDEEYEKHVHEQVHGWGKVWARLTGAKKDGNV